MSASAPFPDAPTGAEQQRPTEPLRVAIRITDPARAELLREALRIHPGLRLTEAASQAEVVILDARPSPTAEGPRLAPDVTPTPPTPREREVLELLALGASNKMIARRLGISVATAKFHVAALLLKLNARCRSDAIAIAVRRGLLML